MSARLRVGGGVSLVAPIESVLCCARCVNVSVLEPCAAAPCYLQLPERAPHGGAQQSAMKAMSGAAAKFTKSKEKEKEKEKEKTKIQPFGQRITITRTLI